MTTIKTFFSKLNEINRILNTLSDYQWLSSQNYRVTLPYRIKNKIKTGSKITKGEIHSIVSSEYNRRFYTKHITAFKNDWNKHHEHFIKNLSIINKKLPTAYNIVFTRYGSGGSYYLPNTVLVNLDYDSPIPLFFTIAHEIIHLAIQDLIDKHEVAHWDKEWLVDNILQTFFPDTNYKQKIGVNKKYETIFKNNFPDIKGIITALKKTA